jgi:hypothetical protein
MASRGKRITVPSSAMTLKRTAPENVRARTGGEGKRGEEGGVWGEESGREKTARKLLWYVRVVKGSPRALRMLVKYTVPAPSQGKMSQIRVRELRNQYRSSGRAKGVSARAPGVSERIRTFMTFNAETDVNVTLQHFDLPSVRRRRI